MWLVLSRDKLLEGVSIGNRIYWTLTKRNYGLAHRYSWLNEDCLPPNSQLNCLRVQSSPVNFCWASPTQSFMVSCPVGAHDRIFVLSKTFKRFEMGPPLRRKEGSDYYWSLPLYWGDSYTHSLTLSLSRNSLTHLTESGRSVG
jgi:hypothetical protein